jgi:hypothetical protein
LTSFFAGNPEGTQTFDLLFLLEFRFFIINAKASGEAFLRAVISEDVVYYVLFELLLTTLFLISGKKEESFPLPYPLAMLELFNEE